MVEHDPSDIELIQRELSKGDVDYEAKIVQTGEAYESALVTFLPDIILSDYSLPTFDGPTAFKMKEKISPHTPFIFVSGTIGEENSIELIKNGVTDYALKDKLFTLNPKIKRALKESKAAQEKVIAEVELIKNEKRLTRAQQVAHIGSWQTNLSNFQVIWSDEIFHIFEIDRKIFQPTHTAFLNFVHPEDQTKVDSAFLHSIEKRTVNNIIEHRIISGKGRVKYVEERWEISYAENGNAILAEGTCQDITEKKEAEIKLKQSELHFRALIHNITDAIILINANNELIYQSPSVERITGFVMEDSKNKTVFEFIHPDDLNKSLEFFQKVVANPGIPLNNSYRVLHKHGHYIWIEGTITNLLHDESVKAFIVNYRDITERKIAETEIANLNESLERKVAERTAQLTEANKALEAFSYSVSHDLKSPVRTVLGFVNLIQKEYGASFSADLKELFEHIESSTKRMKAIIDDLLTLAKFGKEKLKPATVNMNNLVKKVWDDISFSLPHRATLDVEQLPEIEADISMMEQVLVNLLSNAVKYSSKKETPLVQIGFETAEGTTTYFVKDNGAGFDMRHYNRMFGAFQRLHGMSEFEGTGIGLLLVKQIIERHSGTVWAEGKTGEGATFYFSLPGKNEGMA